jgi:hypothetical protein
MSHAFGCIQQHVTALFVTELFISVPFKKLQKKTSAIRRGYCIYFRLKLCNSVPRGVIRFDTTHIANI